MLLNKMPANSYDQTRGRNTALEQYCTKQLWPHGRICGRTLRKFLCYLIQNLQEWGMLLLESSPSDSSMEAALITAF